MNNNNDTEISNRLKKVEDNLERIMANAENSFQIGDVVGLISGGPLMTVTKFAKGKNEEDAVFCSWFNKDKTENIIGRFPRNTIEHISKSKRLFNGISG